MIDVAIIQSLDLALYGVLILLGRQLYSLQDEEGRLLTKRNKVAAQSLLSAYTVKQQYLQHSSVYDEMIGNPVSEQGNTLLVPLGDNDLS